MPSVNWHTHKLAHSSNYTLKFSVPYNRCYSGQLRLICFSLKALLLATLGEALEKLK